MEEVHKTSSSSPLCNDEKAPKRKISCFRRHRYRTLAAVAGTIALLGITLGVGLGVGLTNAGEAPKQSSTVAAAAVATSSQGPACQGGLLGALGDLLTNTTPIWQPPPGASWQIVLSKPVDATNALSPALSVYDIDMYGNTALTIQQMHSQGIKVICYFSAGSWETYRPDAGLFAPQDIGNNLNGWPGERWLNTQSKSVRDIMANRIKLAAEKGCDAVDPDNIDGFVSLSPPARPIIEL